MPLFFLHAPSNPQPNSVASTFKIYLTSSSHSYWHMPGLSYHCLSLDCWCDLLNHLLCLLLPCVLNTAARGTLSILKSDHITALPRISRAVPSELSPHLCLSLQSLAASLPFPSHLFSLSGSSTASLFVESTKSALPLSLCSAPSFTFFRSLISVTFSGTPLLTTLVFSGTVWLFTPSAQPSLT